jgi:hypothetical protein
LASLTMKMLIPKIIPGDHFAFDEDVILRENDENPFIP